MKLLNNRILLEIKILKKKKVIELICIFYYRLNNMY